LTEAEPEKTCESANTIGDNENLTPEMLVRKHASAVLALCMAHTKNFHDSEDIMQNVFLRAFMKFDTLRDKSRVRSWLLKIARRMCIDFHRKRTFTKTLPDDIPSPPNSTDEHIRRLHTAVSKLPDGYREPIILYYLDGRKCADVAKSLGISEDTVRSRLLRARLRLHDMLLEDQQ